MILDKLSEIVRTHGWRNGLLYGLARLLNRSGMGRLHYYLLYAQPLREQPRLPARRGATIAVRPLEAGAAELAALPRPTEVISERFQQDAQCLAAYVKDEFAGCAWYVSDVYHEDEVCCDFDFRAAPDCIWDFDVYVAPAYRNGIVFMRLWDELDQRAFTAGKRYSLSRISAFNQHSIASHERLGARRIGWAAFLGLGPAQLSLGSHGRTRLHLTRQGRARHRLQSPGT